MSLLDKPQAVDKFRRFQKNIKKNDGRIGTNLRMIELVYNTRCNFQCKHCSTRADAGTSTEELMTFDKIRDIANQAHELGIYELNLYGGELLIRPDDVFSLLESIKPERFYTFLTTNGYLMTQELANRLASSGMDRVSVSLDSINPEEHDAFRGHKGAHERALKALEYIKEAGMQPHINVTVSRYNAGTKELERLFEFSKEQRYITMINVAMPSGHWRGNFDVLINDSDRDWLNAMRKKYKNILRDLWDPFDREYKNSLGCQAMSKLHVAPNGDVFPCSFIHIRIGNLYEQSMKEIVDYGYSIKYFHEHCETCLAGENKWFSEKFMCDEMSLQNPLDAKVLFTNEDYVTVE